MVVVVLVVVVVTDKVLPVDGWPSHDGSSFGDRANQHPDHQHRLGLRAQCLRVAIRGARTDMHNMKILSA